MLWFDCSFCHVKNNNRAMLCSLPIVSETIFATVQKKNSQTKKSKKKEKEGKITRTLFDTFSHTTDTHTHTRKIAR